MELAYLAEEQNQAFDYEYHSEEEFAGKLAFIRSDGPRQVRRILDVGGGNGKFMDRLLAEFPDAEGWVVDISQSLLDANAPNPRKHLIHGSFDELERLVGAQRFDLVTINWVLHHLVGSSYRQSVRNAEQALVVTSGLLTPEGILFVAENEYEGVGGANLPSRIIYAITRVRQKSFVRLARRYFNTAGVGVCFQSRAGWRAMFRRVGLKIVYYQHCNRWTHALKKRLMFLALALRSQSHGHFALRRSAAEARH